MEWLLQFLHQLEIADSRICIKKWQL